MGYQNATSVLTRMLRYAEACGPLARVEHPEAQRRLRHALVHGSTAEGDAELERVVKEGLRLFPGYGLFGRTAQEDLTLGGYQIPKGTLITTCRLAPARVPVSRRIWLSRWWRP